MKATSRTTGKALAAVEAACFGTRAWSEKALAERLSSPDTICFCKYDGDILTGYVLGVRLSGDFELYRLCVLPRCRHAGIGSALTRRFIEQCRSEALSGVENNGLCESNIFLEVRAKNNNAIALYKKAGFTEISRRKNYYGDDDAVVMRRSCGENV